MKTYGLTGGIGMGKSTTSGILRRWRVPVVDTDELARAVVEPGQLALAEIQSEFGPGIVGADGRLRRDELARRVFRDTAARTRLEGLGGVCLTVEVCKTLPKSWNAMTNPSSTSDSMSARPRIIGV